MEYKPKTEEWIDLSETETESSRINTIGFIWVLATAISANVLFGGVNAGALGLLSIMLALGVVFWIADSLFTKRLKYSASILQLPFLGLIMLGLFQLLPFGSGGFASDIISIPVSTAFSIDPYATKLTILKITLFLVFFASALIYLDSPKRLRVTVFVLIIFGALMSFVGILQRLSNPNLILWVRQVDYASPFASYVNQHHFAAFMVMMIALTLGLLFSGSAQPDKRPLLGIAVALMGIGTIFTTSRGALISLIAVLAFLTVLTLRSGRKTGNSDHAKVPKSKAIVLIAGNAVLLGFLFISVAWIGGSDLVLKSAGVISPKEFSNGRLEFWENSLEMIRDNPIIGTGLGTYGVAYTPYDEWNGTLRVGHAHNDYLEILSDGGIIGFLFVAVFLFFLFRKGLKTISAAEHPNRRGIATGALAACFGILVHSIFDFPLQTNANMFFFLICAALATVTVKFPAVVSRKKVRKRK